MSIKISFIIPMYNSGRYIENSVNSILRNNYKNNIEILVVDDCSTDNSFENTKIKFKSNQAVKVHKTDTNSGPGIARNLGVNKANGKYICFLDADDQISENFYKLVSPKIDQFPNDVIRYNFGLKKSNKPIKPNKFITKKSGLTGIEYYINEVEEFGEHIQNMVWQYLIPKQKIIDNQIYFLQRPKYFEDVMYNLILHNTTDKVQVIDEFLVIYQMNANSMVNSTNNFSQKIDDFIQISQQLNVYANNITNDRLAEIARRQSNLMIYFAYKYAWYLFFAERKSRLNEVKLKYKANIWENNQTQHKIIKGNNRYLGFILFKNNCIKFIKKFK